MIKKLIALAFSFISFNALAYTHGHLLDSRLTGTSWAGLEYGIYNSAEGKNTADYNKQLLLFNVAINFVENEITWHDGYEWDISPVTICVAKLSKTNDKKALKVWKRMGEKHQSEMDDLERAFCDRRQSLDVMDDTTLNVCGLHVKFHMEEDRLVVDLLRQNDTVIALLNENGGIGKTINYCKNFSARITDYIDGMSINRATWTYWIEDKMFCFCFGHKNYILKCPFTMSADGKIFKLVLKKKKD